MANSKIKIELPNENPDIGKEGVQSLTPASEPLRIPIPRSPTLSRGIPPGIAGVWHSHKKQGTSITPANVLVPGSTFAMIVPLSHDHSDNDSVRVFIRVDLRDASGMATSTSYFDTDSTNALKFLNDNFTQTRFQG